MEIKNIYIYYKQTKNTIKKKNSKQIKNKIINYKKTGN